MRGGALPVLAWACIIGLLFAGLWIWTGDPVEVGAYGFAVLLIALCGLALTLADREAIRRGPPPAPAPDGGDRPQKIPDLSLGAVGAALGLACAVFGLAFGHFMVYFGCGLLALSLGRLALELRAERDTRVGERPGRRGGGRA